MKSVSSSICVATPCAAMPSKSAMVGAAERRGILTWRSIVCTDGAGACVGCGACAHAAPPTARLVNSASTHLVTAPPGTTPVSDVLERPRLGTYLQLVALFLLGDVHERARLLPINTQRADVSFPMLWQQRDGQLLHRDVDRFRLHVEAREVVAFGIRNAPLPGLLADDQLPRLLAG